MPITSTARARARIRQISTVMRVSGLDPERNRGRLGAGATASASAPPPHTSASRRAPTASRQGAPGGARGIGVGVKYGVDSYFGSATEASVKAFQRYKGLPVTGVVDQATAAALGLAAAPARPPGRLPRPGAVGQQVKQLRQALVNAGMTVPGGVDGIFGRGTEGALKRVPAVQGPASPARRPRDRLPGSSAAARTATAAAPAAVRPRRRSACASAARPGRRVAQQALLRMGWTLRGGADGIFGTATQGVLILAQPGNGIPASGIVDEATARLSAERLPAAAAAPARRPGRRRVRHLRRARRRVVALQTALINAGITVPGGADGVFGRRPRSDRVLPAGQGPPSRARSTRRQPPPSAWPPRRAAAAPAINVQLEADHSPGTVLLRRHVEAARPAVSTSVSTSSPPRATSSTPWPRAGSARSTPTDPARCRATV